jgi:dTDP-4-dehydrorhamnose reductase
MNKALIIGSSGALGKVLFNDLSKHFEVYGTYKEKRLDGLIKLDIARKNEVKSLIEEIKPSLIVILSAKTNVEECEKNKEECDLINFKSVENILDVSEGKKIVFISTDAIFDGEKEIYSEEDSPNPQNNYGNSKLLAEKVIISKSRDYLIIRTSRLFGENCGKFINKILENLKNGKEVFVPKENYGNFTYIPSLSKVITDLILNKKKGIYHACGEKKTSLEEAAFKIAEIFNLDQSLIHLVDKDYFNKVVKRPSVVLDTNKLKKENLEVTGLEEGLRKFKNPLNI